MVCAKCQKLNKTTLATPGVKKKAEMYYGSPASSSSSSAAAGGQKKSATLGQTGISKVSGENHTVVETAERTSLSDHLPEQTPVQGSQEPLCPVLERLHPLQDQGLTGPHLLQPVCLPLRL